MNSEQPNDKQLATLNDTLEDLHLNLTWVSELLTEVGDTEMLKSYKTAKQPLFKVMRQIRKKYDIPYPEDEDIPEE